MQRARGRWNTQRPRITCLYTAYTERGALAEYDKLAREPAYSRRPRDLVSVRVDVAPVLDLTNPDLQAHYTITVAQIIGERSHDLSACRRVVRRAVIEDGYRAVRAPSAAMLGEMNLMIYPESQHGRLLLSNGGARLCINHGPHPLRP